MDILEFRERDVAVFVESSVCYYNNVASGPGMR
jgi:hypothetical protein